MNLFRAARTVGARALLLLYLIVGQAAPASASLHTSAPPPAGPALVLLAGSEKDVAGGVAVDAAGNVYITGSTYSDDFPVVNAAHSVRAHHGGATSAFVAKLGPSGNLVYSTFLGGGGDSAGNAIAVDAQGNAYVTGVTDSRDFPTTRGAVQPRFGAGHFPDDAFVVKLGPTGKAVYSTYLGGPYGDSGTGIAVDSTGAVVVTGYAGPRFPLAHPIQSRYRGLGEGGDDAFVARIDPAGKRLIYSTYLGGFDKGTGIAVDRAGNAYVTGTVRAAGFPTLHAFQPRPGGGTCHDTGILAEPGCPDAFVSKLSPSGRLVYSTYLGGTGADYGAGIAVDRAGRAYVAGTTTSVRFPGLLPAHAEDSNAFLAMLAPGGRLLQSARVGGTGSTVGTAVSAVSGDVVLAAETSAVDTGGQHVATQFRGGFTDGFVAVYTSGPGGFSPLLQTYVGGRGEDTPLGVALSSAGTAYLAGSTTSTTFDGPVSGRPGKRGDAFVAAVPVPAQPSPPPVPTIPASPAPGLSPEQLFRRLLAHALAQRSFQITALVHQGGAYDATVRVRLRAVAPNRFRVDVLNRAHFPSETGGSGRTIEEGSTGIQVGGTDCVGPIFWICSPVPAPDIRSQVSNLLLPAGSNFHVHYRLALLGPQPAEVIGSVGYRPTCPFYAVGCPSAGASMRTAHFEATLTFDGGSLLPLALHSTWRYQDRLTPAEQATFSTGHYTIMLPHYPRVACPGYEPKGAYCMKEPRRGS